MRASDFPFLDVDFVAMAHRGGSIGPDTAGRENTLAAFSRAIGLGYRYLETDVHATSDGFVVAFHDDVLDRVSDVHGRISDFTLADLRSIRVGGTETIPTLDAVLDSFPAARVNIDIKDQRALAPLAKVIERHRAQDRVCVCSFSAQRLRAFRRLMGRRVATAVSSMGIAWNAYVPLAPRLVNSPGAVLQLPVSTEIGGREVRVLTRRLVRHAHAAGKKVHVWTINDADTMTTVIDMGVDGIISDSIDVLRDVLVERNLWKGA